MDQRAYEIPNDVGKWALRPVEDGVAVYLWGCRWQVFPDEAAAIQAIYRTAG